MYAYGIVGSNIFESYRIIIAFQKQMFSEAPTQCGCFYFAESRGIVV